jgi:hypothetical protein
VGLGQLTPGEIATVLASSQRRQHPAARPEELADELRKSTPLPDMRIDGREDT